MAELAPIREKTREAIVSTDDWNDVVTGVNQANGYGVGENRMVPMRRGLWLQDVTAEERDANTYVGSVMRVADVIYQRTSLAWVPLGQGSGGGGANVVRAPADSPPDATTIAFWYDTTNNVLNVSDGTNWRPLSAAATIAAGTIGTDLLADDAVTGAKAATAFLSEKHFPAGAIVNDKDIVGVAGTKVTGGTLPLSAIDISGGSAGQQIAINSAGTLVFEDKGTVRLGIGQVTQANLDVESVDPTKWVVDVTNGDKIFSLDANGRFQYIDKATAGAFSVDSISTGGLPINKLANGTANKYLGFGSNGVIMELDGTSAAVSTNLTLTGDGTSGSPLGLAFDQISGELYLTDTSVPGTKMRSGFLEHRHVGPHVIGEGAYRDQSLPRRAMQLRSVTGEIADTRTFTGLNMVFYSLGPEVLSPFAVTGAINSAIPVQATDPTSGGVNQQGTVVALYSRTDVLQQHFRKVACLHRNNLERCWCWCCGHFLPTRLKRPISRTVRYPCVQWQLRQQTRHSFISIMACQHIWRTEQLDR